VNIAADRVVAPGEGRAGVDVDAGGTVNRRERRAETTCFQPTRFGEGDGTPPFVFVALDRR
jgi:hypothetical protein